MSNELNIREITQGIATVLEPGEVISYAGRFTFDTPNKMFEDVFRTRGAVVAVSEERVIIEAEGVEGFVRRSQLGTAAVQGRGSKAKATIPIAAGTAAQTLLGTALQLDGGSVVIDGAIAGTIDELLRALNLLPASTPSGAGATRPAANTPGATTAPPGVPPSSSGPTTRPAPPVVPSGPSPRPGVGAPPSGPAGPAPHHAPFVTPMIPGFNQPTKRKSRLLPLLILGMVSVVGVLLAVTLLGRPASSKFASVGSAIGNDPTSTTSRSGGIRSSTPTSSGGAGRSSSSSSSSTSTTSTTTTSGPQTFRVVNTGRCDGKPCRISLRVSTDDDLGITYTDSARSKTEGDPVRVMCQTLGRVASDTDTGRSSNIWNKLDSGYFISDLFVNTPTNSGATSTLPVC